MQILPLFPQLGQLDFEEIFEFYDFPRLFTARNLLGETVLCLSVADARDKFDWLFVQVSAERKQLLIASSFDLASAFLKPEGAVWHVTTFTQSEPIFEAIRPAAIPQAWLPEPAQYLQRNDVSLIAIQPVREMSLQQTMLIAKRERRDIGNLLLKQSSIVVEAPARTVGNLLRATQDLLDALGQVVLGTITARGAIPPNLLEQTQINASAVFSGSFGIQLKAKKGLDLLDASVSSEAFGLLFGLMDAKCNEDSLSNLLHAYKGRVAGRFRAFLEALDDADVDVGFEWASPQHGANTVLLTNLDVQKTISLVTKLNEEMAEEVQFDAHLIGLNLRTKSFELLSQTSQEKYVGKINPEVIGRVSGVEIGGTYSIKLRKTIDVLATTGEERIRWILVDIGDV
jgi:hypothetical protein